MPDLIIDGLKVSVPTGTLVIDAAERLGVMIPRFCYHPALGGVGSCRMCAVMFADGPVKGLRMSCMVKAQDKMVVDTGHPEVLEYREHIAKLLMLHHPHDCPVCDEGGHCLLQDTTISCGHSLRAFQGRKRTYRNQDLGPLVAQEMNRCIHCYRCVRYYQEFAGGRDFGARRIAGGVSYGRYQEGALVSVFAGNLTEICPTGVFTDKPSRHQARHWDLERAPGVCLHCSLGCSVEVDARYRRVVRIEARYNPEVNGHFICDRGRHGYEYASLPQRPRQALVDGAPAPMDQALDEAARRLQAVTAAHGPGAVAALGSSRQSLESQAALKLLAARAGWPAPEFTTGSHRKRNMLSAVRGLSPELRVSLADIARADAVLVVGAAPLSEAPMLALSLRQAARKGAAVAVIDPRPVELPLPFTHIPSRRHDMEAALGAVLRRAFPDPADEERAFLEAFTGEMPEAHAAPGWEAFADQLGRAAFPVVVCGSDIVRLSTPDLLAGAAELMRRRLGRAGFFPVLAGANAFGAALMNTNEETSFDDVLEGIESGRVKALVCLEADPVGRFAASSRAFDALSRLELLVAADCLPSRTMARAHVFLPTRTVFEAGGHYANQEGRIQRAYPAHACGTPLAQSLERGHPSHDFALQAPGSAPLAAPDLALRLMDALGLDPAPAASDAWSLMASALPCLEGRLPDEPGFLCSPPGIGLAARPSPVPENLAVDLLITEQAFGTEELSSYGSILKALAPHPQVVLHEEDAATIELRQDEQVHLACAIGDAHCFVRMAANMARSTVVVPRRPDSGWQSAVARGYIVELSHLEKRGEGSGEEAS
ncbi:NADH-quinone oxidoreductase subunit G [Fundidesulfovibrio magnetotacticus]|uniref:NADH-quinone oxidoreductase n=1 Tax=Fundidesulfovibrio magnetotacticus TaxID=2730080 RepID=A0A6V8LQN8_9BACT|nr:NADH-quinone oxidoreductase subunit NuoG [Fundidesulfovibrio magnetotacticus]GFK92449.1 NADH-quinone oxidoreductase subunit G [Fundidesulfovibrio magnetotacticus]